MYHGLFFLALVVEFRSALSFAQRFAYAFEVFGPGVFGGVDAVAEAHDSLAVEEHAGDVGFHVVGGGHLGEHVHDSLAGSAVKLAF